MISRRDEEERTSPPKSPPPFSKVESRFEREQRIKVGSLDSYTPGSTLQRQKRCVTHFCRLMKIFLAHFKNISA